MSYFTKTLRVILEDEFDDLVGDKPLQDIDDHFIDSDNYEAAGNFTHMLNNIGAEPKVVSGKVRLFDTNEIDITDDIKNHDLVDFITIGYEGPTIYLNLEKGDIGGGGGYPAHAGGPYVVEFSDGEWGVV
jgi:hypothetical protein